MRVASKRRASTPPIVVFVIALIAALVLPTTAAQAAPTTSISGKVNLPDGLPTDAYSAIYLGLYQASADPDIDDPVADVSPGANGAFEFTNLPAGNYRLLALPDSGYETADGYESLGLASIWYTDSYTREGAQTISTTGGNVTGLEFDMKTGESISGTVTVPAGTDPEWTQGVAVYAESMGDESYSFGYAAVNEDGTYTITGLAPGDYMVSFSAEGIFDPDAQTYSPLNLVSEYWNDKTSFDEADPVTVTEGTPVTNINAALATGAKISGKVTLPSGTSVESLQGVSVVAFGGDFDEFAEASVLPNGDYSVVGMLPGSYTLAFLVDGYSTYDEQTDTETVHDRPNLRTEFWNNVYSAADATPVTLTAGQSRTGFNAALEKGRQISGTVTLPSGVDSAAFQGIEVGVEGSDAGVDDGYYVGEYTTVRPNGTYTVSGLGPDTYTAYADSYGYPSEDDEEWVEPNIATQYWQNAESSDDAKPINLTSADVTGINFALKAGKTISGTVTVPPGTPNGWWDFVSVTAEGEEDISFSSVAPDGTYSVQGLNSGDYVVSFDVDSEDQPLNLTSEYYNNQTSYEDADPVTVSNATPNATGINALLDLGGTLDVTLTAPSDATGFLVAVDEDGWPVDGTPVEGAGTYKIDGLAAGAYHLAYIGDDGAEYLFGAGGVSSWNVTTSATIAVATTLRPLTASIAGSLKTSGFPDELTGRDSPGLGQVTLFQKLGNDWVPLGDSESWGTVSSDNGDASYTFTLASGTYRVGFTAADYGAFDPSEVSEEYWNNVETFDEATDLTLGDATAITGINGEVALLDQPDPEYTDISDTPGAPGYSQFFEQIQWMIDNGITTGYDGPDGTKLFKPRASVERGAMAAFIYRAEGEPEFDLPTESPFADVPTTHPFYKEIAWMYEEGLSTGTPQKSGKPLFKPKAPIKRDAMAAFMFRLSGEDEPTTTTSPFGDVTSKTQFFKEIVWMFENDISTGTPRSGAKPLYKPLDLVSREAMAAFVYRFYEDYLGG